MKKILLIEDDYDISKIYAKKLSNAGFSVDEAVDGDVGTTKATKNDYDLILLDVMLPKRNGLDVLKSIRDPKSAKNEVPIFILTNLGTSEVLKKAKKFGIENYLIKAQFTPNGVVEEVSKFFRTKEDA